MKHFSTGTGIAVLGVCILAATVVATHRGGSEAFAQGTGTERRIVSAGIIPVPSAASWSNGESASFWAYRIWSDNAVDVRCLGRGKAQTDQSATFSASVVGNAAAWVTVDNGTSGFRPLTDVDMSGETDAGDISQVLMDFNTSSDDLPPPPIDCTINAPR
jgi:hypothetical protein